MTSKLLKLTALSLATLPLAGCMKMTVKQQFFVDGTMNSRVVIDLSAFYELADAMEEAAETETGDTVVPEYKDPESEFTCESWEEPLKYNPLVLSATCEQTGTGVFVMVSRERVPKSQLTIKKSKNRTDLYLRTKGACSGANEEMCPDNTDSDEMAGAIFTGTYTIIMPGKVASSNVGKVRGNTVFIDDINKITPNGIRIHAVLSAKDAKKVEQPAVGRTRRR